MTSERQSSHKIIFPLEFCQSEFHTPQSAMFVFLQQMSEQ
jgi:hypothetical protein